MKSIGVALTAAVLLCCAVIHAAEPMHTLQPLPADSTFPAAAPAPCGTCNTCGACNTCCGAHACRGGQWSAWLNYHPLHRMQCGECSCCCEGRWVPLYLYFLGQCREHPCSACGAAPASCGCASHGMFGSPTGVSMFGD